MQEIGERSLNPAERSFPSAGRTSVRPMDKDVLVGWLAEGLSLEEIGRRVGRHPSTVSYWLRKYGLEAAGSPRHRSRGSLSPERLAALVAQDLSVRQIAVEVNRSPGTVIHWLSRFGLRTTDTARRRRPARPASGICAIHGETDYIRRKDGSASCARCRSESVSRWRREAKRALVAELGGACSRCGYARAIEALHFHHVDPATKRFGLGRAMSSSMESLREEAAKCILLCANCHAEEEAKLRGWDSNPQPLD